MCFQAMFFGEINSNCGYKQEHVESCSSSTESMKYPLPHWTWPPNLTGWLLTIRDSQSRVLVRSGDKFKA